MKCLHSQEVNISSDQIFLKCLGSRKFWNEHLLCPGWFEMFGMECFEMNRWNEHLLWPECFAGWFRSPSQWLSLPQRTTVPHHATSCHSVTQPCASQLLVHLHVHHLVHLQNHIRKHLTSGESPHYQKVLPCHTKANSLQNPATLIVPNHDPSAKFNFFVLP